MLSNDSIICPHVIVNPHLHSSILTYYYVTQLDYDIPKRLYECRTRRTFVSMDSPQQWIPTCHVKYHKLKLVQNKWYLSKKQYLTSINRHTKWDIVDFSNMRANVVQKRQGQEEAVNLQTPQYQHPDVSNNNPFIFVIFGSDAYHHTEFTGVQAQKTHGGYWWTANFNPDLQFSRLCTFIAFQSTALASLSQILPKLYIHWQYLMQHGCIVFNGQRLIKMYGMVSHHIGDMQDRDIYSRRRGSNNRSRSDGLIWLGYQQNASWPTNMKCLLNVGCVVPGNYLLKVWQFLFQQCVARGVWWNTPDKAGKCLTLTKCKHDVYNELPIDSTLKAPLEINHTTLLGLLTDAFEIEWVYLHHKLKFNEFQTKTYMFAYLTKFWHNNNGLSPFTNNIGCNILKFNQMQHSWQKMLEIMISVPHVCDWIGNLSLLSSLIRMTGCLFSCRTETRRLMLQCIVKKLLTAVDERWGHSLNTPKMRHFKQIFAYLRLYNQIRFIDGKFVELLHDIGKTLQSNHSNHHTTHKEQVSSQCFHQFTLMYAVNGGHWGPNMQYCLGNACLNLRNPKNLTDINPVLKSFRIPSQTHQQHKIQITGLYKMNMIPSPTQQILNHTQNRQFMTYINHGLDSLNVWITWNELVTNPNVRIRKIKQFRFHNNHCSFVLNFENHHKCMMKNNNNQICVFTNAYRIQYPDNQDILLAFGDVWPIYPSNQNTQWIDNKFQSMDYIDQNDHKLQWFYLTNMEEPILLIHECVSFETVRDQLPNNWRSVTNISFHKDFAYNMSKLKQDIDEMQHGSPTNIPCGPNFKCKRHYRHLCRQCTRNHEQYSRQRWRVFWICNTAYNSQYRILDSKNGFNMTLMKTVQYEGTNEY